MDPTWDKSYRCDSALLRGVHITAFNTSEVNPNPLELKDADVLLEEFLSPRRLQEITGMEDLSHVTELNLRVDTSDTSLGNFGQMLPKLKELRLDDSLIPCVRDLGSSLNELRTLWMQRCMLEELDGICSMVNVVELYLSYNCITDLSPLALCDNLEVLDVEGNNIDEISNVLFLSTCIRLTRLTLHGNPVASMENPQSLQIGYNYRQTVHISLPHLLYLDDELLSHDNVTKVRQGSLDTDWAYLDELRQDALLDTLTGVEELVDISDLQTTVPPQLTTSSQQPRTSLQPKTSRLFTSRAKTPKSARLKTLLVSPKTATVSSVSAVCEANDMYDSTSGLTSGQVVCGNPGKALLARKRTENSARFQSAIDTHVIHSIESDDNESSLMTELYEWRKHHEIILKQIEKDKAPRVLKITPGELADDSQSDASQSDIDDETELTSRRTCYTMSQQSTHLNPSNNGDKSELDCRFRTCVSEKEMAPVSPPMMPHPPDERESQLQLDECFEVKPDSPDRPDRPDKINSPDSGFSSAVSQIGSFNDLHKPSATTW